jgi:hypothetical protein
MLHTIWSDSSSRREVVSELMIFEGGKTENETQRKIFLGTVQQIRRGKQGEENTDRMWCVWCESLVERRGRKAPPVDFSKKNLLEAVCREFKRLNTRILLTGWYSYAQNHCE